jgi:bifunctional enzyme CysN/CysC
MTANHKNDNAKAHRECTDKDVLKFLTCGSVDDGKSTLLGRLIFESANVYGDQLESAIQESRIYGTTEDKLDFALLLDGLQAEREQGITIDVAYRFFETKKRKFIAADAPGHEQYTRNMVTAASNCEAAIVLVDATKGVIQQTKRHSFLSSLLGLKHIILAVNKMDLANFDHSVFEAISDAYELFAKDLEFDNVYCVPICALKGDNICVISDEMEWYSGPTLLSLLEAIDAGKNNADAPLRLPIQWVNRPSRNFRGYCGNIASGTIRVGDAVISSLTKQSSKVIEILSPSGNVVEAVPGLSVTITLADQIDLSRGDILTRNPHNIIPANHFASHIIWMAEQKLIKGRPVIIKFCADETSGQVTEIKHLIDINTMTQSPGCELSINEIGYCKIALDRPTAFDSYNENKITGSFILIDKLSNETVGAGLISHSLDRSQNIRWHGMAVQKEQRALKNKHKPCVVWLTGLSGSGKSTVADVLEQKLFALGYKTYTLDGDNVRHGLNNDLGFTETDRVENIRRVAEVARLMADAGLIVVTAFISPFISERNYARQIIADDEFIEVFVDTPLEVCAARDPKGLYKKARSGQLKNFTGIDSEYQQPTNPEIVLNTMNKSPEELAEQVLEYLIPLTKL